VARLAPAAKKYFAELVTFLKTGRLALETMNLEAFQTRVLPAKNKLFRFAYRLLDNEEEAKDVVQDVLIKVWNGRERMDEVLNWEAWCMRLTKNLSFDRIRSRQRKATDSIGEGFDVRNETLSPHETTELSESMQRINQLIAALPEKQRQVIHLRDIEGYSYNEICEILDLEMSQVKVNLFRARNAVREKLVKINAYGL
jgi:RNA polymerase sigma-70 factor (ECF subfamily)